MHGTPDLNGLISSVIGSVKAAFKDLDTWTTEEKSRSTPFTTRLFPELRLLAEKLGVDVRLTYEQPRNWEFLSRKGSRKGDVVEFVE